MIYDTLKLVHVLAVILWFGGGVMLTLVAGRASRTSTAALAPVARIGAGLGSFFGAVSGVGFLPGVGMVLVCAAEHADALLSSLHHADEAAWRLGGVE